MKIQSFINKNTINRNFTAALKEYDSDQNGFTQSELSNAISGITSKFAKGIVKLTGYDKKIFKELDADGNKLVSYQEMAEYIKKEYNLDFYSFMNMTFKEICEAITKAENADEGYAA